MVWFVMFRFGIAGEKMVLTRKLVPLRYHDITAISAFDLSTVVHPLRGCHWYTSPLQQNERRMERRSKGGGERTRVWSRATLAGFLLDF